MNAPDATARRALVLAALLVLGFTVAVAAPLGPARRTVAVYGAWVVGVALGVGLGRRDGAP